MLFYFILDQFDSGSYLLCDLAAKLLHDYIVLLTVIIMQYTSATVSIALMHKSKTEFEQK